MSPAYGFGGFLKAAEGGAGTENVCSPGKPEGAHGSVRRPHETAEGRRTETGARRNLRNDLLVAADSGTNTMSSSKWAARQKAMWIRNLVGVTLMTSSHPPGPRRLSWHRSMPGSQGQFAKLSAMSFSLSSQVHWLSQPPDVLRAPWEMCSETLSELDGETAVGGKHKRSEPRRHGSEKETRTIRRAENGMKRVLQINTYRDQKISNQSAPPIYFTEIFMYNRSLNVYVLRINKLFSDFSKALTVSLAALSWTRCPAHSWINTQCSG
ncbi:uncharacterized protein [Patagioenas fasciata]|uniref:uncharacterized protein isoform X2 n=1 Tax=Patagioenas fasciata TaxID=372321 RepID=UPI003A9A1854